MKSFPHPNNFEALKWVSWVVERLGREGSSFVYSRGTLDGVPYNYYLLSSYLKPYYQSIN